MKKMNKIQMMNFSRHKVCKWRILVKLNIQYETSFNQDYVCVLLFIY